MTDLDTKILTVRRPGQPTALLKVQVDDANASGLDAVRQVILIHGFANSQADATKSYTTFRATLCSATGTDPEERGIRIWDFHWPGDHPSDHDLFDLGSKLTYPVRIGQAQRAGEALARLLLSLNPRQEVVLVAHSLGCRVALQCLAYLRECGRAGTGARVSAACLLAAAVPIANCTPANEEYGEPLSHCKEVVLFSTHDLVLKSSFRAGQTIFGERGKAVGATGQPTTRWEQGLLAGWDTRLGHSKYWGNRGVAAHVGRLLSLIHDTTMREHHVPAAPLPEVSRFG